MNDKDLKRIQGAGLEIYKAIKSICDKNDIRYYAVGGTAIGLIRHKGFIPWDDDIDIVMPRGDYERFKALANNLPSNFVLTDFSEDFNSPISFMKIQDKNTCYTAKNDTLNPSTFYGVFVDIMPMDGVPSSNFLYRLFRLYLRIPMTVQMLITQYQYSISYSGESRAKVLARSVIGNLAKVGIVSKRRSKRKYLRRASRYNFDDSEYTACLWQFVGSAGVAVTPKYSTSIYESHIDMPFEDTTMRMPVGYEEYFAAVCPGYMTPPPKEKQVPHHDGILDFNKSYLEYAKEVSERS